MSCLRGARGEPPSPAVPSLTPSLVSAAYKRALRFGIGVIYVTPISSCGR
ncbi:hypothetical protein [Thermofilum pendens]|nr:hypothetical protein [Thermofilum pendens]